MTWSWPGIPAAWGYALATAGMILFWTLVIFGAIVLVHYLGRENRSAEGPAVPSSPPNDPPAAESASRSARPSVRFSIVPPVAPAGCDAVLDAADAPRLALGVHPPT